MKYTPHTAADIQRALKTVGVGSVEDLFHDIPASLLEPEIDLVSGLDEVSLMNHLRDLAARNQPASPFIGGGIRRHFIPSVTPHLAMQSEFVTSYTPYQPEVSQGILQATFEYQTMMAELTGLPVSNASMYDGASAAAEAALLACRQTRRNRVGVSLGVNPETRATLRTYLNALDIEMVTLPLDGLVTAEFTTDDDIAGVVMQQPNHLGYLEDMDAARKSTAAAGALLISVVDLVTLAVIRSPGDYDADIAVGTGQTAGNDLAFGGPSFGFMTVKENLVRQLPGRLVGQTTDADGKRAFVLTLQAREQHIRRSKAKSNICTNHQLTAIMASINLAALGPQGLKELAVGSIHAAHDLADRLTRHGLSPRQDASYFNEFVLAVQADPVTVRSRLAARGILAGIPLPLEYGFGNALLMTATELSTDESREELAAALAEVQS